MEFDSYNEFVNIFDEHSIQFNFKYQLLGVSMVIIVGIGTTYSEVLRAWR